MRMRTKVNDVDATNADGSGERGEKLKTGEKSVRDREE